MKNKIEVLAPCGNLENFNVAINSGADAVYFGLNKFNARLKAGNFTVENLKSVVNEAHLFNVKVYLTINTLVKDFEFPELIEMVKCAVECKVDAYLIQDLGVAKLLHDCFPEIVMHASTQLSVHNLYGAKVLEGLGFKRVVLARETKLNDIEEISKNTSLEIEFFVHGALCVSFSGNCYFSSMCFGKSGNRGQCMQLCRLKYRAVSGDDVSKFQYLLSPRDLCLLEQMSSLINAGVTSFKIEGRLKRKEYVSHTIQSCHRILDMLTKSGNVDKSSQDLINSEIKSETGKLKKVFSRGEFNTSAYLYDGTPDNIINKRSQNHLGIKIGKVIYCKPFKDIYEITIQCDHKLVSGDALKFLDGEKQIDSLGVGNAIEIGDDKYKIFSKHRLISNLDVYLTIDSEYEKVMMKNHIVKFINAEIVAKINQPLMLRLYNEFADEKIYSQYVCPNAERIPVTFDEIANQLDKTGDERFKILLDKGSVIENVFIPKSVLNDLRRTAFSKFKDSVIFNYGNCINASVDEVKINVFLNQTICLPKLNFDHMVMVNNFLQIEHYYQCGGHKGDFVVISPDVYDINTVDKFISDVLKINSHAVIGLDLPIIANGKDLILIDNIIEKCKDLFLVANNIYGLKYIGDGRKVFAGTGLNIFNRYAISMALDQKVHGIIASIEMCKNNLLNDKSLIVYSVGKYPVMNFCHCPYKTITDGTCKECSYFSGLKYLSETNESFEICRKKISQCYFEMLNSRLINSINRHDHIALLDLKHLSNCEIGKVVELQLGGGKYKIQDNETAGLFLKEID